MDSTLDRSRQELSLLPALTVAYKRWGTVIMIVIVALGLAAIGIFFLPKKYYSNAKIIPTNPVLTDKGRLFNRNIEGLYSIYGTGDDLDRLYALANTESSYRFIGDSFRLFPKKSSAIAKYKILQKIKKSIELKKTTDGELEIGVWTKDAELSAQMANAMVERIRQANVQYLLDFNRSALSLREQNDSAKQGDSLQVPGNNPDSRQAINEIILAIKASPPPFILIDPATPAAKAGRPAVFLILFLVFIGSTFLAIIIVNILERIQSSHVVDTKIMA